MTEAGLRVCIAVASNGEHFADDRAAALADAGGFPLEGARTPLAVVDGVATIAIDGPLVRKAGMVANVSGLTSYGALRSDLAAAMSDPAVRSIDWAIDSPGGEVSGLFEIADEIHAASKRKPMRALVSEANSAAYVIAAAIGNISIEQAGLAGSIGVVLGVQKPAPDATAPTVIEFVSSASPNKRPDVSTDAGRAQYQARVDYLGEALVSKVAAYRGVTAEHVKEQFGAGGVLVGAQAVAAGLADRIGHATINGANRMDPTIFGLAAGADAASVTAAAHSAVEFRASAIAALGVATASEAIGKLTAAVEALAERDGLRADLANERQANRSRVLTAALSGAVADQRITLGELARVVPTLLGSSRAAAVEAIGASAQEVAPLVAAIASVALSADAVESVTAYLDSKAPATIAPVAIAPAIPVGAVDADAAEHAEISDVITKAADATRAMMARARAPKSTAK